MNIIKNLYLRIMIEFKHKYKDVQNILLEMCSNDVVVLWNGLCFFGIKLPTKLV
jgi:hypothetical protein